MSDGGAAKRLNDPPPLSAKVQRLAMVGQQVQTPDTSTLTVKEAFQAIEGWANEGKWTERISSITDLLDSQLDPAAVAAARDAQMAVLHGKDFALPILKKHVRAGAKSFGYKWVDENKRGVYRSRFTCADLRARCSKADLAEEVGVSAPTPHAES